MEFSDEQLEELLGRNIRRDIDDCSYLYIQNKVCLVTGGGGSVGIALVNKLLTFFPKEIHIIENCESNIHALMQKLIKEYNYLPKTVYIHLADIKNYRKMRYLYKLYKPDIVYHLAAYKHVNLLEENPEEAIYNNVRGTYNIAVLAYKFKSERVITVSSDKAVYPINIMGMTKRLCEMIIYYMAKISRHTLFSVVRLVNVFGSSGSLVPIVCDQIISRVPVTITSSEVERYFMTMLEAVALIINAGDQINNGQVVVMNTTDGVNIANMVMKIISIYNEHKDINATIVYTGLSNNEKIKEQILYKEETLCIKEESKLFIKSQLHASMRMDQFWRNVYYLFGLCKKNERTSIINQLQYIIKCCE